MINMISLLTNVNIIDNSGAAMGRCIKLLRPAGPKSLKAGIGDLILISVTRKAPATRAAQGPAGERSGRDSAGAAVGPAGARPEGAGGRARAAGVLKGDVFKALVVRTKKTNRAGSLLRDYTLPAAGAPAIKQSRGAQGPTGPLAGAQTPAGPLGAKCALRTKGPE